MKMRIIQWAVLMLAMLVAPGAGSCGDDVDMYVNSEPLRLLVVGNSFANDAVDAYLQQMLDAQHVRFIIGRLYESGCSLQKHCENIDTDGGYRYTVLGNKGHVDVREGVTLAQAIACDRWGMVSLQQASRFSGQYDTYEPYMSRLMDYCRQALPQAQFAFFQTWAYADGSDNPGFASYGGDQMRMYQAISDASQRVMAEHDIDLLVPVGTAVQNARTSSLGDTFDRDGTHLDRGRGRYLAACVWLEALTGIDCRMSAYRPTDLTDKEIEVAREAAHAALAQPYQVTVLDWL